MDNQYKIEDILCNCPICNSDEFVIEQAVEIDDSTLDNEEGVEITFSKYWNVFTCTLHDITWGYASWTGSEDSDD